MIVAVDFDGTLHDGEYPQIGEIMPGAAKAMQALHDDGHTIIIWSCRAGDRLNEMLDWLDAEEIPYDYVNEHASEVIETFHSDSRKVYADVYIDDHNIGGLPSWHRIYRMISNQSTL